MFNNNKKQFVNILKQNKQLKLDYKTFQDGNVIKQEHSSFLITDENIPSDALFRLDTLQKSLANTYLVSLYEGPNQKVIPTEEVDIIGYESVTMDDKLSIVLPKNEVVTASRYFSTTGIDYIISPFSILNEYTQDKSQKNSLNVLIYNNVVYLTILNNLKQIVFTQVKELTPFDEVQDEAFSEDEIVSQKLYDEVHFLEIQQLLNDTVQEYYGKNDDVEFLETVELLYTIKPLSEEQIESLYETIMVKIHYKAINIEEYLDLINQKENAFDFSFIVPRVKKQGGNIFGWVLLAIVSIILVVAVLFYKIDNSQVENSAKQKVEKSTKVDKANNVVKAKEPLKPIVKELKKEVIVKLPNHITINNQNLQNIYMLFDVVPYDGILKDLEMTKNGSTYVCNFVANSTSLEDMQAKLLNIYRESKVLLKHQNKSIINSIIENSSLLNNKIIQQQEVYENISFMSTSEATQYIEKILPSNSEIKYNAKEKKEYLKYNFSIKSLVNEPKVFFDFVEKINSQKISIILDYPIVFSKVNKGIEIKYSLIVNQINKKSVELKK